jgi:transposase-like protein
LISFWPLIATSSLLCAFSGQRFGSTVCRIRSRSIKAAAIEALQEETGHAFEIRHSQYLSNLIEPDQRAIKRITRLMLGFKSCRSASITVQGIELMHRCIGWFCRKFYVFTG